MSGLLAKHSAVQKIPSGRTHIEIFTIDVALSLNTAIHGLQDSPAEADVPSIVFCEKISSSEDTVESHVSMT